MPQTSYSLGPIPAVPGMLFDINAIGSGDVVTEVAGQDIPFGVICELNAAGKLVPLQDVAANWPPAGVTSKSSLIGVSIFAPMAVEMGYRVPQVPYSTTGSGVSVWLKGQRVPCLRRGRIWMAYDGGGTPLRVGGAFNVWHSSDGTHLQGAATFTAVSATVGAEIDIVPAGFATFNDALQAGSFTDPFGNANGVLPVGVNLT